jgi:hypothetical protein
MKEDMTEEIVVGTIMIGAGMVMIVMTRIAGTVVFNFIS